MTHFCYLCCQRDFSVNLNDPHKESSTCVEKHTPPPPKMPSWCWFWPSGVQLEFRPGPILQILQLSLLLISLGNHLFFQSEVEKSEEVISIRRIRYRTTSGWEHICEGLTFKRWDVQLCCIAVTSAIKAKTWKAYMLRIKLRIVKACRDLSFISWTGGKRESLGGLWSPFFHIWYIGMTKKCHEKPWCVCWFCA